MTRHNGVLSREQIEGYRRFIFQDGSNLDLTVFRLLSVLGFRPNWSGTDYLREAVKLCHDLPATAKVRFNDTVYPAVARICNSNKACVERDIRTALRNCYFSGGMFKFNDICGYEIVSSVYPPTNVEFITQTVFWLRMRALEKGGSPLQLYND